MLTTAPKYIVDDAGNPQEVIISYEDFCKIEEMLGLDLEDEVIAILKVANQDRMSQTNERYVTLENVFKSGD